MNRWIVQVWVGDCWFNLRRLPTLDAAEKYMNDVQRMNPGKPVRVYDEVVGRAIIDGTYRS